eukprot:m.1171057 g.1171057  ORF g.1171057 m.1171057 type:complete len:1193 (+) comp24511_c0_seq1:191-3769(+)
MRATQVWGDQICDKKGIAQSIHGIAFKPDGTLLIAGAGNRVLVYETSNGDLVHTCKGHKGAVYCVAYSQDGRRYASGAADKNVIIWNELYEGELQFSHNDAIQCIAFSPTTHRLITCSSTDFGFWATNLKSVPKVKVASRICCCAWTNDGRYVALGMANGVVSIRDENGDERSVIRRPGDTPVWSVAWNPSKTLKTDELVVCDWNQRVSFYMLSGRPIRNERALDYDPCAAAYFSEGDFLVMGGSDKKLSLHTPTGVKLHTICEQEGWIWTCATRPGQRYVAVGCSDGTIAMYQLIFSTVHGLYKNQYAYRNLMTDVVLQDLETTAETRIKCKDLVKKIAIYKNSLAVLLPKQINIYELYEEDGKIKAKLPAMKIKEAFECTLLVVCSRNVILGNDRRLLCVSFTGKREREWLLDATIRYIKVAGGPEGREGLLVGLGNGQILYVFVDNAFPIELIKQGTSVRCLDLSASRKKLAVVDEHNTCIVYDLATKEILYQERNANSATWNSENEDMLCYSGSGYLHMKAGTYPVHRQKMQGFVVGFQGSSIYSLHVYSMMSVDVPQSYAMYQYLNDKHFAQAYKVACLGVTDSDWRALGVAALDALELDIAKNCFIRVRDVRSLELINNLLRRKNGPEFVENEVLQAVVCAHRGDFDAAAELYERVGDTRAACDMYTDLRIFDKANKYLTSGDREAAKRLMQKQKEWSKSAKDPAVMIDIYLNAGEYQQAVETMGKHKMHQRLIDKARELNAGDQAVLTLIASELSKLGHVMLAAEVYNKIGDESGLAAMYVEHKQWTEAFALVERHPDLKENVYLPYANYLAEVDKFDEAQVAFHKAGYPHKAEQVLKVLTHNATVEHRFGDAAYYFWQLSISVLTEMCRAFEAGEEVEEAQLHLFNDFQHRADVYYAYESIHKYIHEPFTSHIPDSLFNIARYLLHCVDTSGFLGVSKVAILYAVAKQSRNMGAYKLARQAYKELQSMKVPASFREELDRGALTIQAKPPTDAEDIVPLQYRKDFVYSFYSFETLPLVEFFVEEDIEDDEAIKLINDDRNVGARDQQSRDGADVMSMDDDSGDDDAKRFANYYSNLISGAQDGTKPEPIVVDRAALAGMPSSEVYVQKWPAPLSYRYYRNVIPDVTVILCASCNHLFHTDDFELQLLQQKACPFCRKQVDFDGNIVDDAAAGSDLGALGDMSVA